MVEVTDEMAKKMMAGTAYESIELEDTVADTDAETQKEDKKENKTAEVATQETEVTKEPEKTTREYTEEEKSRFAQILRAKYSDRTMTDYIECQEYLESKKKHLANAKQAQEKLRSQALTYMQSIMNPEKRKTLPKGVLADVAKNGNKFIEKFGYDADGATNPITMKFRDWMDRNKESLQKIQEAGEKAPAGAEAGRTGTTEKTSILGAVWEEKQSVKVGAFLMGFGGACLGALAGGPQGAVLGGVAGATAGAGLVATIVAADKRNAVKQAKKAAKAQEKINQNQKQKQKEQAKTKESKVDWHEVGFWGKMIAGCSAVGAGIGGFMAYTAAHATAVGVAGSAAAITSAIGSGAVIGALAIPAMVVTYKVGTWLKEKAGNVMDNIKAKKQEKAMQKQAEKAKNKTAEKTKSFNKADFMDKLHTAGFIAGLSGLAGAGLAVIGQAYPAGADISIPVWTAAAAGIGLGATAVAATAYKVGSWLKGKFSKSAEQKHVKVMEAQTLTQAREQTEQKLHTAENNKNKDANKQTRGQGYKGKVSDASMRKMLESNDRSA